MVRESVEVEIAGKRYPMNFSMAAVKKISDKYGSMKKFEKLINEINEDEPEKIAFNFMWVTSVLIEQGCALRSLVTGKEIKPVTEEELYILVSMEEMEDIVKKVSETIYGSSKREVEAKPSKKEASAK